MHTVFQRDGRLEALALPNAEGRTFEKNSKLASFADERC